MDDGTRTVPHRGGESVPIADEIASDANSPALDPADEQLARILVRMWSLASGRRLRQGVRPHELSAEELIDFWADDLAPVGGRHARGTGHAQAAA